MVTKVQLHLSASVCPAGESFSGKKNKTTTEHVVIGNAGHSPVPIHGICDTNDDIHLVPESANSHRFADFRPLFDT